MAQRSLNKVMLIGNLTRDPELRYTPQGTAVCTFGLATNRGWVTEGGDKKEETEFHRIVAWNKLAELCSQLLFKGRRIYVEGRLQTRQWTAQDGTARQSTEVVADTMMLLDSKRSPGEAEDGVDVSGSGENAPTAPVESASSEEPVGEPMAAAPAKAAKKTVKKVKTEEAEEEQPKPESKEINPDEIPF